MRIRNLIRFKSVGSDLKSEKKNGRCGGGGRANTCIVQGVG